ncbi:MAG: nucleotidyltransferase domain-containing protein [Candidatus Brockarchaeota archaeon]|nr:nucleotidyltransferase domain-containing protein [Candidatus Brockarchaeota archaeon]
MEFLEVVRKIAVDNQFIAGIILFGSAARGEEEEKSDLDLIVLWENLNVDPGKRHAHIYSVISKYFPYNKPTVLEMEYSGFLNIKKATPLVVNIIWDGVVLYDRHGKLKDFMSNARDQLVAKGLVRRKAGKYYYWELPKPGAKVELEA